MSTLRTDTLTNAAGTKSVPVNTVVDGSAKAWVNFNGNGTVAIVRAFNVSSITDNGVGDYTANFTTPLPDGNYATVVSRDGAPSFTYTANRQSATNPQPGSVRVYSAQGTAFKDSGEVSVVVYR